MKMTPKRARELRAQCSLIQRKDFPVHYGVGEHKGVTRADIQMLCRYLPDALDDLEEAIKALREMRFWLLDNMDEYCHGCGVTTDWELLEDISHKEGCHLESTLKFIYSVLRLEFKGTWQEDG